GWQDVRLHLLSIAKAARRRVIRRMRSVAGGAINQNAADAWLRISRHGQNMVWLQGSGLCRDCELSQLKRLNCTGVACNKVRGVFGYWYAIDIAAGLNFFGYLGGNILDPVLKCVVAHDANRTVELTG